MTVSSNVYADYNATSPLRPVAREAMLAALDETGNPSSIHAHGRAARKRIEEARACIAEAVGLLEYRLVFTSGASEALATVLRPSVQNLQNKRHATKLLINRTEHAAALDGHGFAPEAVSKLSVKSNGVVDCDALEHALKAMPEDECALVCVQSANSETGVLQPLGDISLLCDIHNALLVTDHVQGAGRIALGAARPAAVVVSSHKVGGPSGVGAILYNVPRLLMTQALIRGGGQERGLRAGTENPAAAAGFAAALGAAARDIPGETERLSALRDRFEMELVATKPNSVVFSKDVPRLPNTSCFALPDVDASLALMQLDLAGLSISSGSACSSGKVKASHVLAAMGVEQALAACALRVSFGFASTQSDVDKLLAAIKSL
ncbi:MAG: aminotransferase class V-fold PLP-dependent enzyme [Pseudomonadota bacterium]